MAQIEIASSFVEFEEFVIGIDFAVLSFARDALGGIDHPG